MDSNVVVDLLLRHARRASLERPPPLRSQQEEAELPPTVVGRRDAEHRHRGNPPAHLLHLHRADVQPPVGSRHVPDLRSSVGLKHLLLVLFFELLPRMKYLC